MATRPAPEPATNPLVLIARVAAIRDADLLRPLLPETHPNCAVEKLLRGVVASDAQRTLRFIRRAYVFGLLGCQQAEDAGAPMTPEVAAFCQQHDEDTRWSAMASLLCDPSRRVDERQADAELYAPGLGLTIGAVLDAFPEAPARFFRGLGDLGEADGGAQLRWSVVMMISHWRARRPLAEWRDGAVTALLTDDDDGTAARSLMLLAPNDSAYARVVRREHVLPASADEIHAWAAAMRAGRPRGAYSEHTARIDAMLQGFIRDSSGLYPDNVRGALRAAAEAELTIVRAARLFEQSPYSNALPLELGRHIRKYLGVPPARHDAEAPGAPPAGTTLTRRRQEVVAPLDPFEAVVAWCGVGRSAARSALGSVNDAAWDAARVLNGVWLAPLALLLVRGPDQLGRLLFSIAPDSMRLDVREDPDGTWFSNSAYTGSLELAAALGAPTFSYLQGLDPQTGRPDPQTLQQKRRNVGVFVARLNVTRGGVRFPGPGSRRACIRPSLKAALMKITQEAAQLDAGSWPVDRHSNFEHVAMAILRR